MKISAKVGWITVFSALLTSCLNDNVQPTKSQKKPLTAPTVSSSNQGPSFVIINVQPVTATSTSTSTTTPSTTTPATTTTPANTAPLLTVIFNAVSTVTMNDVCQPVSNTGSGTNSNSARACKCRFQWTERATDGSKITRSVDTDITQVTSAQVQCNAPSVFDTEIPDQTILQVSVVADSAAGNNSGFTTNSFPFKKSLNSVAADFRDSEGRSFKNIFHYSCYDKVKKHLVITHARGVPLKPDPNFRDIEALIANRFTTGTTDPSSFSAQSYYYDFYVRSHEKGSINASNPSLTCPQVNINGSTDFFPMDSTFALALNPSAEFPVRVTANIIISANQGSDSGNVLGFASSPDTDGTCPAKKDLAGNPKPTYRLRQYRAVYPLRFKATGELLDQSQPSNTIYVLDRPVQKSSIGNNKPITRLGPKPCPWAFRSAQFGYKCMTSADLNQWSIDGTQVAGDPSCPVYPPPPDQYLKADGTFVIRPYKPFLPHYLENTNFKACAFQSSVPVDPQILLSHDSDLKPTNVGPHDFYCAVYYPNAGSIVRSPTGDSFDKPPSTCSEDDMANAIKGDRTYACSRTHNPTSSILNTPSAGCCQICAGTNCTASSGGLTPRGRNAAYDPPQDLPAFLSPQAFRLLPRATPNAASGGGCFDPSED